MAKAGKLLMMREGFMRKVSKTVLSVVIASIAAVSSCTALQDPLLIICPGGMLKQGTVEDLEGRIIRFDNPSSPGEYALVRAEQCMGVYLKKSK